jgi:hypothetical protein
MTPKEKATALVLKFMNLQEPNYNWFHKELAKQCALIAVDELMKQCWDYRDIDVQASYDYWEEVKQEIEKL